MYAVGSLASRRLPRDTFRLQPVEIKRTLTGHAGLIDKTRACSGGLPIRWLAAWRRGDQPAFSGLLGVGIAAVIAYQTGDAKDYFLVGIWLSFVLAVVFLASVLLRRPLVGVIWGLLSGRGKAWRADRRARVAYDVATLAVTAVFAARFVVQNWLYGEDFTGWLAFARIAMGYPLTAVALVVIVWAIRRSDSHTNVHRDAAGVRAR